MKNIAIITARGNNKSIKNKNLITLGGKTLLGWQITAALNSKLISSVYISTDCKLIIEEALKYNIKIINRPKELSKDDTNHGDVIVHAAKQVAKDLNFNPDIITILLGNTIYNDSVDIDNSIQMLIDDKDATSSMTVWLAQDDHPYRAMRINKSGYLTSFQARENIDTNRQSYPNVYYYDQGPWSVRFSTLMGSTRNSNAPACWWWMGDKCIPIIREWITGRDIHGPLDILMSDCWLNQKIHNKTE